MFHRLKDPLVVILLVICAFSFITGDSASGRIVLGMILIGVLLGYFQERRSSEAAEKLKLMVQANSIVARGGKDEEIPVSEVVPGDVVVALSGDPGLTETLERTPDLKSRMAAAREFDLPKYRIAVLSESTFAANRKEYEAIAISLG
jgi:P-type Mg2+ transporter